MSHTTPTKLILVNKVCKLLLFIDCAEYFTFLSLPSSHTASFYTPSVFNRAHLSPSGFLPFSCGADTARTNTVQQIVSLECYQ